MRHEQNRRHNKSTRSQNTAEMPGKTPEQNGNKPLGNSTPDVEMKDDISAAKKGGRGKNAAQGENMTVVVPLSKTNKSAAPPTDAEGDIAMDEEAAEGETPEVVDPVAQTISSKLCPEIKEGSELRANGAFPSHQERLFPVGKGCCVV